LWGILKKLFAKRDLEQWVVDSFGGVKAASGVYVTEGKSLSCAAVYACVRVLAETVASLPLILYRRLGKGKERAVDNPLYTVLHDAPNPELTSFEMREAMMGHLALWGNAYAEVVWGRDGLPKELWPLRPDRMTVERVNGELRYWYTFLNGERVSLPPDNVLHIRGLSHDGIVGYSPVRLFREAIGLSLAMEEFGARFFGDGTHLGGIVEHPAQLSEEAYKHLQSSLAEKYSGLGKSHRILLLEEGMKWTQVGIPPEDAQFLESRKFQLNEIARIFRIPPHMVGDLERSTYSNVEQQAIDFVVHTIRPWLVRWEQAINKRLLGLSGELFVEFLVEGLLRGDTESRFRAYSIGRQWGWLSANDVRELENLNPIPGGDTYLVPLNMVPAGGARAIEGGPMPPVAESRAVPSWAARHRAVKGYKPVLLDAVKRIVAGEVKDIRRKAQQDPTGLLAWAASYYDRAKDRIASAIRPVVAAVADTVAAHLEDEMGRPPVDRASMQRHASEYAIIFGREHAGYSLAKLTEAIERGMVEEELDSWESDRVDRIVAKELVNMHGVLARVCMKESGATKVVWVNTKREECPYCRQLNGKVVPVGGAFVNSGEVLSNGAGGQFVADRPIRNPPLHAGCECILAPGDNMGIKT
jgi:HK97 family phage portal protein